MTHTARQTPVGTPFDDGYQSLITFSADPDLSFWEQAVGAPGIDGGDAIPTSSMHNASLRTFAPRKLKSLTPFQVQGKFSSGTLDQVNALVNVNGWITITWPDDTLYSFPGFLKSFNPGLAQEGNPMQGTIEVVPTMQVAGVETDFDVDEQGTGT
jgi:hypothetical protein